MRNLFSFRILFAYTILIVVMSVIPVGEGSADLFPFLDKIIHFLIYALLAFLAINTFRVSGKKIVFDDNFMRFSVVRKVFYTFLYHKKNCYIKVFLYCFCVGLLVECIQYFLPYRGFEGFDILANSAGSVVGILVKIT